MSATKLFFMFIIGCVLGEITRAGIPVNATIAWLARVGGGLIMASFYYWHNFPF